MRVLRWGGRHRLVVWLLLAGAVLFSGYLRGTAYMAWRQELQVAGFTGELLPPGSGERILIVAPHPDDEVLGCAWAKVAASSRPGQDQRPAVAAPRALSGYLAISSSLTGLPSASDLSMANMTRWVLKASSKLIDESLSASKQSAKWSICGG